LELKFHPQHGGVTYLTGTTRQHTVWVNAVPEVTSVKHRVHFDIDADSVIDLVALGAEVLHADDFRWTVMTDPMAMSSAFSYRSDHRARC
jgi:hypothetical protein